MAKKSSTWKTSKTHSNAKKICPHCGHDDFKITGSKFSWLLGEKFKCLKCGGTFKTANLVRVKAVNTEGTKKKISSRGNKARKPHGRM